MKNVLVVLALVLTLPAIQTIAQTGEKGKKTPQPLEVLPITDIPGTASAITSFLKPKLAISDAQSPKVIGQISEFLKTKSAFIEQAKSNPTEYIARFNSAQARFQSELRAVLTPAQYSKFLDLKPKSSDSGNLLSHLFF